MPVNVDNIFEQAQGAAMPSVADRETASSRIQSRIAAQTQGQNRQLQNRLGGMGRAGGGAYRQGLLQNAQNANNALATGLADVELGFNKQRQEGANILGNLGLGVGRLSNEQMALQESARRNQVNEAIDFFRAFGESGNLHSGGGGRGPQFDVDFQNLLSLLFGRLG